MTEELQATRQSTAVSTETQLAINGESSSPIKERLLTCNSDDYDEKHSTASDRDDDYTSVVPEGGPEFKTTPYRWLVLAVVGLCIVM